MFQKYELCEKWDFENVNFMQNETFKMWILSKNEIFKVRIFGYLPGCGYETFGLDFQTIQMVYQKAVVSKPSQKL